MDYEDKGSNIIVLGLLALSAMFFAYLIHSSKQTQSQPIQTAQLSSLDTINSQTQSLLNIMTEQSHQINQLNYQQSTISQLLTQKEPVNVVSMPTQIKRLNKDKLGFSDSSESIAASFGMV